jgi:hypothetical protein
LRDELLELFARGVAELLPEGRFDELARRVFAHQFAGSRPYRAFCGARGRTPETIRHWCEIPAVPTAAFKELPLCTFPPEEAAIVFETSGTTAGGRSGRHYMRTTALYDAALMPPFVAHVLPEGRSLRMLSLGPTPRWSPRSSLGYMLDRAISAYGAANSAVFATKNGIDVAGFADALAVAVTEGAPVCLLGTAFAFVHVLDSLAPTRYALPVGSRLMDTGGYKGRSREVPRAELVREYERTFGIPADCVVSEYGMTEMSSQFYQQSGPYIPPPWVRTVAVDPESLAPLPGGATGLLRHYDLANLDSVMAIQTDDLGVVEEGGFRLLGRASGAEARGCSLAVEELLEWR